MCLNCQSLENFDWNSTYILSIFYYYILPGFIVHTIELSSCGTFYSILCTYFLFAQLLDRSLKGNVCWCCHAHTLKHKCTAIHPFGNSKWPLRDRSARKNFKTLILASEANRALLQNYLIFFPRFSSLWHAKKLMGGPNFFLSEYFEGLSHWKHYV